MTILALEFSSERRSVALARAGQVLAEAVETGGYRVTNAFGLIQRVLAQSGVAREAVEVIAIGLGPGSYTGIRAAIAVAQGWQLAREVKLLGISSVECLVAQAQAKALTGLVDIVIDAQRGEFYLATWRVGEGGPQVVEDLKIVSAAEIAARAAAGSVCIGPDSVRLWYPDAVALVRLAMGRTNYMAGDQLEPVYLRETTFVKAPAGRVY
jgi:tRNA threonylcarbamoyladenosine biosynthesis protein TsaB